MSVRPYSELSSVTVTEGVLGVISGAGNLWLYQNISEGSQNLTQVSIVDAKTGEETIFASDSSGGLASGSKLGDQSFTESTQKLGGAEDLQVEDPSLVTQLAQSLDVVIDEGVMFWDGQERQAVGAPRSVNQVAGDQIWLDTPGILPSGVSPVFIDVDSAEVVNLLELFDFDVQLPSSAVIDGIEVEVTRTIRSGSLTSETGQFQKCSRIAFAPDMVTWVASTYFVLNEYALGIAYMPGIDRVVAVGEEASASDAARIWSTSDGGATWQKETAAFQGAGSPTILRIFWDSLNNLCIAVNSDIGTSNTEIIQTSPDGDTWTYRGDGDTNVAWSNAGPVISGSTLYIAGGRQSPEGWRTATSANGTTWTDSALITPSFENLYSMVYSTGQSLFIAVGNLANAGAGVTLPPTTFTSSDGSSWTDEMVSSPQTMGVAYSPELDIAVFNTGWSPSGTGPRRTVDGASYSSSDITELLEANGGFINTGYLYSTDLHKNSIIWIPERAMFVAYAGSGGAKPGHHFVYSVDGIVWREILPALAENASGEFAGIAYDSLRDRLIVASSVSGVSVTSNFYYGTFNNG